jgi:hypothetical protein
MIEKKATLNKETKAKDTTEEESNAEMQQLCKIYTLKIKKMFLDGDVSFSVASSVMGGLILNFLAYCCCSHSQAKEYFQNMLDTYPEHYNEVEQMKRLLRENKKIIEATHEQHE